jgi:hypothetical protein
MVGVEPAKLDIVHVQLGNAAGGCRIDANAERGFLHCFVESECTARATSKLRGSKFEQRNEKGAPTAPAGMRTHCVLSIKSVTELFKKPLIPVSVDAAWENGPSVLIGIRPASMLVLARPYVAGSREEATLINMLKACGFAEDAVNIIQVTENERLEWRHINAAARPSYAMLLGVPPSQLGISALLPASTATEFAGVTFIWTSTLQHLTATEASRKALWVDVLQPIFKKA